MDASQYQVSFPYGSSDPPYSTSSRHRGDDRPCPTGTPIIINGVVIGLTGATGKAIGAHLHIQEWSGDYANTREPQNAFQPGTVTNVDPDGTQGDGSFGKFITIQAKDGWCDSYCHLSRIDVKVGDIIGGDMLTPTQIDKAFKMSGKLPTQEDLQNPDYAKDAGLLIDTLWNTGGEAEWQSGSNPPGFEPYAGKQLFTKK